MELNDFIKDFADQFDETDFSEFAAETKFRELEEWSSLTGLALLNMIKAKYKIHVTAEQLLKISTIGELFNFIQQ
ncbi:MAG: phosphopantetheine-binding protein [Bacteroidetes bacterium]|nr:phosphopantetheine-binding protein [Bacteroidota bacterium]